MITRVITIGSNAKCDFVINKATWSTLREDVIESIKPIHAQIIQDDACYYLVPFSDYIFINGIAVKIENGAIQLGIEDRVSFGIDVFWQQWMAGLGLNCNQCVYRRYRLPEDGWCRYCEEQHYNPDPYIYGYSHKFKYGEHFASGYYNYTDCMNCSYKPDWCIECSFFLEPQPKNMSFKDHVEMYIQRLNKV